MTPSARAAALRSTALATSLVLAIGWPTAGGLGQAKSSTAEAAADRAQRGSQSRQEYRTCRKHGFRYRHQDRNQEHLSGRDRFPFRTRGTCPGARDAPACGLAASAGAQTGRPGGGGRDVIDLAGRHRRAGKRHRTGPQAQARGCDPGSGGDIGSGRAKARGMDHPAQRRQWRLGRALSRLHRGQSELAVADLPAPAHRGGAVGRPSRRRHRVVVVCRTNRRCRPRENSRWRGS